LGAALGACGTGGTAGTGKPVPAKDRSDSEPIVNWANWTYYLDYDERKKVYPTLERFQEQT
jgi:spermidine/putrescine transport system substrate-binding protein